MTEIKIPSFNLFHNELNNERQECIKLIISTHLLWRIKGKINGQYESRGEGWGDCGSQ